MPSPSAGRNREQEALAEIGGTVVHALAARLVVALFLALLLSGAALELAAARGRRENLLFGDARLDFPSFAELAALWRQQGALAAARRWGRSGVEAQRRTDVDSRLARRLRPPLQSLLLRALGFGNSQVLVGSGGWLYYRDDFEHLTAPPFLSPARLERRARGETRHPSPAPDPVPALVGLAEDLRARSIAFVVLPVPTKLGIAWERFLGTRPPSGPALANPSQPEFLARLRAAKVEVFDPTPILRAMELQGERPYMRFDSHWSPAGLERVAAALAASLRGRIDLGAPERFHRATRPFERRADLGGLLDLAEASHPFLFEALAIQTVDGPGHRPFNSRRADGPVLLVGDSFSRLLIRNRRKGGDANFAAQLAFHLQSGVAMMAENDAGGDFARRVDWLRQPHALDGRRLVVFEVAERALSLGDWTPARLAPAR